MAKTFRARLAELKYPECFKLDIGPIQETAAPPAPSLCACGAELMGERAKALELCGDCASVSLTWMPAASLDQRIAEAQPPKVDKDPTAAWSAGQTPGYEWP